MMNALSRFIGQDERVLTVEDAAELQLQQPHVVRLETRPNSLEGKGEVTQRDLVRNALRMRPDRIIIGEVRGGEAFDMLQAMNTGHDGSMSTIHANNTRDALTRIENMVQMGHMGLPSRRHPHPDRRRGRPDHPGRAPTRRRPARDPGAEICGMEGDVIAINDIFSLELLPGQDRDGRLFGKYQPQPHGAKLHAAPGLFRAGQSLGGGHGGMTAAFPLAMLTVAALLILVGIRIQRHDGLPREALEKRLVARREAVLRPHMRTSPIDIRLFARRAPDEAALRVRVASLFGIDLERSDICPVPVVERGRHRRDRRLRGPAGFIAFGRPDGLAGLSAVWVGASRGIFSWYQGEAARQAAVAVSRCPDDDRACRARRRAGRRGHPHRRPRTAANPPRPNSPAWPTSWRSVSRWTQAITAMARHAGMAEYRFFATALTLQSKAGGALSGTLESLADMIRKRVAVKQRAHALASEARMSIYVLTGLPVCVAGGMAALNPRISAC